MLNWLFLDMNSYFAAVEQQDRPELRGRPVGIVPVAGTDHTCCIAASVEAKKCGIRTGTGVGEARALCPGVVIVEARPEFYVQVHHRILAAVDRCVPIHKVYSIDEWAIRLLRDERKPRHAARLAKQIKQRMAAEVGEVLTCSIGLSPTRLLAKIASDLNKPDGLTVLTPDNLLERLGDLPLTDLTGISDGMLRRLNRHGIFDVPSLYALSMKQAREVWGSVQGEHYWYGLHGIDMPEPVTHRHSMGHAHVMPPEFRSDAGAHAVMTRLLHKAAYRLRHHGYLAHHLHASVRYESGTRWGDDIALPTCQDTQTILEHFQRVWERRPTYLHRPKHVPKKVSVTLTQLTPCDATPALLFPGALRRQTLSHAMDRLNLRFGKDAVYFGGMHECRHKMDEKIAFGRIPDEALLRVPEKAVKRGGTKGGQGEIEGVLPPAEAGSPGAGNSDRKISMSSGGAYNQTAGHKT